MITCSPDDIEEHLEAHKVDINAIKISSQAATAFVAQARPNRPMFP